jgi:hypothetical protein
MTHGLVPAKFGGTIPMMWCSELAMGKTMSDADAELGPVDYVVVAFPAG